MSFSLSTYPAILYHYGTFHFFIREFSIAFLGILLMWGISYFDMDKVFNPMGAFLLLFFGFVLLIFFFLPQSIAPIIGGARRWLKIPMFPIAIAPIEFFKIGFIWFLAWTFTRKYAKNITKIAEEFLILLPHLGILIVVFSIVAFVQNDLGQAFLIGLVMAGLVLLSGGSLRIIFFASILGILAVIIGIISKPHRLNRIKTWWSGIQDPLLAFLPKNFADYIKTENLPEPYQIINATHAIQNGGLMGQGIGEGVVKLGFLSDVHTDMVLAGIAEESGFLGIIICFFLFFLVLLRIFKIANRVEKKSYFLFCMGAGLLIGFSLIINAFGIAGIIPLKGIAVPFLTYGGSSLLANCIIIGMVLSLSKKAKNLH